MSTTADQKLQGKILERLSAGTNPVDVVIEMVDKDLMNPEQTQGAVEAAVASLEAGHTPVCAVRAGVTLEETEGPPCVCPGGLREVVREEATA